MAKKQKTKKKFRRDKDMFFFTAMTKTICVALFTFKNKYRNIKTLFLRMEKK